MNVAIITVVPHPGATFPYSEFNGFSIVPKVVTFPFEFDVLFFEIVVIKFTLFYCLFTFYKGKLFMLCIQFYASCSSKGSLKSVLEDPKPI